MNEKRKVYLFKVLILTMNRSNHRKCSTKISFSKPLIYITFSYASLSLALTNVPVFWLWSDTSLSLSLHFVKTCLRRPFLKIDLLSWRSSLTEVFCKKGALKKFKKLKGKHLCQSLRFLIKLKFLIDAFLTDVKTNNLLLTPISKTYKIILTDICNDLGVMSWM